MSNRPDPVIEQIEAELKDSRFQRWDVEAFLANRHQAKIEALRASENKWARRWQAVQDIFWAIMGFIGVVTTHVVLGLWLLTGEFPLHP